MDEDGNRSVASLDIGDAPGLDLGEAPAGVKGRDVHECSSERE
jgi:hypothetical protein